MKKISVVFVSLAFLFFQNAYADSLKLSVPPLVANQQLIDHISEWDGHITVMAEQYSSKSQISRKVFYYLDQKGKSIKPLIIKDGFEIVSLAENTTQSLALCLRQGKLFLLEKSRSISSQWAIHPLSIKADVGKDLKLAATDHIFFLVAPTHLWHSPDLKKWKKLQYSDILKDGWGEPWSEFSRLPEVVLASEDAIFLGFDRGEWGGAAHQIPLGRKGPTGNGKKIASFNVREIKQDPDGIVWIAGGLSHKASEAANLYRYTKGKITVVISQYGIGGALPKKSEETLAELPASTDITGLAISKDGKPVILASRIGILEYSGGKFSSLIPSDFYSRYRSFGSFPQGMLIRNDDIYVGSRSLGVFEFKKKDGGYNFYQFTFADSSPGSN